MEGSRATSKKTEQEKGDGIHKTGIRKSVRMNGLWPGLVAGILERSERTPRLSKDIGEMRRLVKDRIILCWHRNDGVGLETGGGYDIETVDDMFGQSTRPVQLQYRSCRQS